MTVLSQMLEFTGIEKERLRARWVSSAEAPEFVEEVNDFINTLTPLGPSPLKATLPAGKDEKAETA